MKKSLLKLLIERDKHCWHCGATENLVPHHRKNRGMGGRQSLDSPANLILICADYNWQMESDARLASEARVYKHKLRQTDGFYEPLFDKVLNQWFLLDNEGRKFATDTRTP